jgi:hypothetical protein
MDIVEEYDLASGNRLKIVVDSDPMNPRKEYDNLAVMAFFHRRYDLGDKNHGISETSDIDEMVKEIKELYNPVLIYPVYMYDHSGISISLGREYPYNDRWDSGMIGFVFIPRDKVLKEWKVKRISPKLKATLERNIRSEIEIYDYYLQGRVYGFIIEKNDPTIFNGTGKCESITEEIDSCWGFYGEDIKTNGILDHILPDKLA